MQVAGHSFGLNSLMWCGIRDPSHRLHPLHAWHEDPPSFNCYTPAINCTVRIWMHEARRSEPGSAPHQHQIFDSCSAHSSQESKWNRNHLRLVARTDISLSGSKIDFEQKEEHRVGVQKICCLLQRTWTHCTSACSWPSHACLEIPVLVLAKAQCLRKSEYVFSLGGKGKEDKNKGLAYNFYHFPVLQSGSGLLA